MPRNHFCSIPQVPSTVLCEPAGRRNPKGLAADTLPEPVEGAVNPTFPTVQHMRAVQRRLKVFVPQRLVDSPHVATILRQRRQPPRLDLTSVCESSGLNALMHTDLGTVSLHGRRSRNAPRVVSTRTVRPQCPSGRLLMTTAHTTSDQACGPETAFWKISAGNSALSGPISPKRFPTPPVCCNIPGFARRPNPDSRPMSVKHPPVTPHPTTLS